MNLQAKKIELVQQILNIETPSLLEKLSAFLNKEVKTDWWDEIPDSIQKSIVKAKKQAKNGETVPHDIVMKQFKDTYGIQL
ncbi:MAG: hypothetical protein BWY22_01893 [Bacteroidetes bacterium ADurb.Bin217]|nr:MAG: hypothetical protein BWY22_01893 [Bacteroidetes bacterium ADurb.Bin217]